MLIFNKEQAVREMCEKILTKATDRLFKLIEDGNQMQAAVEDVLGYEEMLREIIEASTSVIPGKIQSAWHKLGPFFNFFYNTVEKMEFAKLSSFRNVNLITKIVDMVCKIKDHMQQGFNYNAPPIEMAIRTLGKLVRC